MQSKQQPEGKFIPPVEADILQLDIKKSINEFQTHDLRISLEDYKIFEIKCITLDEDRLPFGEKPRKDTEFERVNPQSSDIVQQMNNYKERITGVMMPRDLEEIRKIENKL